MNRKIIALIIMAVFISSLFGCELDSSLTGPYTIAFDTQGGDEIESVEIDRIRSFYLPNATKKGHTFLGWIVKGDDTERLRRNVVRIGSDTTLIAQWLVNHYTIEFDSNGGSEVDSITQDYGTCVTTPTDPIREGYAFVGWNPEAPTSMPEGDITLFAQWQINPVPYFDRYLVESDSQDHMSGYRYTSFGGGAIFAGQELYIQHSAPGHFSTASPSSWGVFTLYVRNDDGTFTGSVLDIDYSSLYGGVRDVNLSVSPDGEFLYVKYFTNAGVSANYGGYLSIFDTSLNLVTTIELFHAEPRVAWGNTLQDPQGHLLFAAYSWDGISVYRSNEPADHNFDNVTFTEVAMLTRTARTPVEATIAYWNDNLVMVTREINNNSGLYAETKDLTGVTGWSPMTDIGVVLHAPALLPYNDEPYLLVSGAIRLSPTLRKVGVMYQDEEGQWSDFVIVDNEMTDFGGYNSFVKNRFGYGMMYFDGTIHGSTTRLWFIDIDIIKYLPQLDRQEDDEDQ